MPPLFHLADDTTLTAKVGGLNEFLKEHRKVEEQEKRIDALTAQLKEQAALIQKVSAQVEMSQTAPQVVNNNQ